MAVPVGIRNKLIRGTIARVDLAFPTLPRERIATPTLRALGTPAGLPGRCLGSPGIAAHNCFTQMRNVREVQCRLGISRHCEFKFGKCEQYRIL